MIVVVEPHNAEKHGHLLEQMFRMRARIFHDHLGWDVVVKDGMERDKYDEAEWPVHVVLQVDVRTTRDRRVRRGEHTEAALARS